MSSPSDPPAPTGNPPRKPVPRRVPKNPKDSEDAGGEPFELDVQNPAANGRTVMCQSVRCDEKQDHANTFFVDRIVDVAVFMVSALIKTHARVIISN